MLLRNPLRSKTEGAVGEISRVELLTVYFVLLIPYSMYAEIGDEERTLTAIDESVGRPKI